MIGLVTGADLKDSLRAGRMASKKQAGAVRERPPAWHIFGAANHGVIPGAPQP